MLAYEVEKISNHEFEGNDLTGYDLQLSCIYCGTKIFHYEHVNEVQLTCERNN